MRAILLASLFTTAVSCNPSSDSKLASRAELDAELRRVLGVGIPASATDLNGQVMTAMTHVVDLEFTCDQSTFESFWDSTPILAAENAGSEVVVDSASPGPDFDSNWIAGGGTQFCTVDASSTASGAIRVVIRSTHE